MPTKISVGELLSSSLSIYLRSLGPILVVTAVVYVPLVLLMFGTAPGEVDEFGRQSGNPTLAFLITTVGGFFAAYVGQGVITRGTYHVLRGEGFPLGLAASAALGRLGPLLLLAIAITVLTMMGYMLLIIPGIMIQCALFVAVPVLMVEGGGVGQAVRRSFDLTAGYRLRIFGLYLLVSLLVSFPATLLSMGLQFAFLETSPLAGQVVHMVIMGTAGMASAVAMVVTYYRLRDEVEGVGIDQLADVFA